MHAAKRSSDHFPLTKVIHQLMGNIAVSTVTRFVRFALKQTPEMSRAVIPHSVHKDLWPHHSHFHHDSREDLLHPCIRINTFIPQQSVSVKERHQQRAHHVAGVIWYIFDNR